MVVNKNSSFLCGLNNKQAIPVMLSTISRERERENTLLHEDEGDDSIEGNPCKVTKGQSEPQIQCRNKENPLWVNGSIWHEWRALSQHTQAKEYENTFKNAAVEQVKFLLFIKKKNKKKEWSLTQK